MNISTFPDGDVTYGLFKEATQPFCCRYHCRCNINMMCNFCSSYDKVLKGFTVGEAIFMVLVSWQSLADFSVLKKGIVLSGINAVAFSLHTRSFGWRFTIYLSLQTMIMFSIIVSLSFPLFVCLPLSCSLPASLFCQPGSRDSR